MEVPTPREEWGELRAPKTTLKAAEVECGATNKHGGGNTQLGCSPQGRAVGEMLKGQVGGGTGGCGIRVLLGPREGCSGQGAGCQVGCGHRGGDRCVEGHLPRRAANRRRGEGASALQAERGWGWCSWAMSCATSPLPLRTEWRAPDGDGMQCSEQNRSCEGWWTGPHLVGVSTVPRCQASGLHRLVQTAKAIKY